VFGLGERQLFPRLRELRTLEWWSPERLDEYQVGRLARLLAYAAERSPYYGRTWGYRPPPTAPQAREVLCSLPRVSKQDLQLHIADLVAEPRVTPVTRKITGGSTGQAVTVLKDRRATAYERAAMWLGYSWRGIQIGDRAARFWGAPFAARRRWLTKASDWAMHRVRFSAFAFSESDLERYWRRCLRFRPDYFHGYVSMLDEFARFVQARGYDGRRLGVKAIIATSEVLSAPQRKLLEEVFGASVLVEYGCGELGPIAYDCDRGRLHLMTPDVVVEILRPDGTHAQTGETGEIVVTDLNNRAMPLVRYNLGDFGVPGPFCECGRGLPTLDRIWGRAYDFIGTPDGKRYHGEFFMYLFEDLRRAGAGVQAFQVTQHSPSTLEVAIVSREPVESGHDADIRRLLQERIPGLDVAITRVAAIERAPSGKMQVIRNTWAPRTPPEAATP
jgi:phenylacetate-CoA ligase